MKGISTVLTQSRRGNRMSDFIDRQEKTLKERSFDEMIAYFNRRVADMDINQGYKMELLGMVTALGFKHEKSAQPEIIRCKDCKYWERDVIFFQDGWCRGKHRNPDWYCADAERRADE